MKKDKYEAPELQRLGDAAKLTLGGKGGSADDCNCAKKKGKAV